jgi:hypothetical protein
MQQYQPVQTAGQDAAIPDSTDSCAGCSHTRQTWEYSGIAQIQQDKRITHSGFIYIYNGMGKWETPGLG